MNFTNQALENEYRRWQKLLGARDSYETDHSVGMHCVLDAHFLICEHFHNLGQGIGGVGPRSLDLLESAVGRQFTAYGGQEKWVDVFEKCASLMFGLIKNHPFHDANKRTALLVGLHLLDKNKKAPTLQHKILEQMVIRIADDTLTDDFLRKGSLRSAEIKSVSPRDPDRTVRLIAKLLKGNTRHVARNTVTVTYHQLHQAIKKYGFELRNPSGNYIDVCRMEEVRRGFFSKQKNAERVVKLAQIGFPGWKVQVGRAALKTTLMKTGLTREKGHDIDAIFHDAESLALLIDVYARPLMRLATR